ncbi:hypothetical protein BaRGS_00011547 [Batillaria attramentaria]|uniref:Uncharacterized protein n=1 Tax=Batillaria attramentaria TaxID=370345 RepID=A0ABD0LDD0_9CAEN
MSVSSLSTDNSEENADSVFETFSNYPSGVSVNDRLGITGIGVKDYRDTDNDVKENGTVSELQRWSEAVKTIEPGVVDDRRTGSTHLAVSNCETISEALEEDSVTAVQTQLALPVSKPLKKLTIVEETNHAEPVTDSVTRTTYPAHKLRPSTAAGFRSNDTSRRHTLYVSSGSVMEESDFDIKNRRHSSVCAGTDKQSDKTRTLLQKRRKSSATSLRAPLPTGAKSNSSATSERHQQVGVDKPRPRAVTLPNKRCETPDSVPPKSPLSLKNFSSETQSAPPLGSHPHNLHTNSHSTHQTAQRGLQKPVRDHQADKLNHHPSDTLGNTGDAESGSSERPASSQWRRELAREKPPGLSPSVSSLGTVIKAAMVFSKAARQRALSSMVEEHNVDTREVIRQERLRVLQSRASVLNKIMSQFPVQGNR